MRRESQFLLPRISARLSSSGSALIIPLDLAHARELDGCEVVDCLVQFGLVSQWEEDLEVHEKRTEDQGCSRNQV